MWLYDWEQLRHYSPQTVYEEVRFPEDLWNFRLLNRRKPIPGAKFNRFAIGNLLVNINDPHGTITKLDKQWHLFEKWLNRMSMTFACLTAFLYATARLALLALAFAAFRKQDERLYVDTWARFLPSIG